MMKTKKLYDEGQAGQDHKGNLKMIVVIMRIMLLLWRQTAKNMQSIIPAAVR